MAKLAAGVAAHPLLVQMVLALLAVLEEMVRPHPLLVPL
jgi:hypothetical protein